MAGDKEKDKKPEKSPEELRKEAQVAGAKFMQALQNADPVTKVWYPKTEEELQADAKASGKPLPTYKGTGGIPGGFEGAKSRAYANSAPDLYKNITRITSPLGLAGGLASGLAPDSVNKFIPGTPENMGGMIDALPNVYNQVANVGRDAPTFTAEQIKAQADAAALANLPYELSKNIDPKDMEKYAALEQAKAQPATAPVAAPGGGGGGPMPAGGGGGGGGAGGGGGGYGASGSEADSIWGSDLTDPAKAQELRLRAAAKNVADRENNLAAFYGDAAAQQGAMAEAVAFNEQQRAARMAKYQAAFDTAAKDLGKYANINPTRAYDNLGIGGQIAAAIAAGAAGWLNPGGANSVLDALDKMANQDIEAQKATFQNKRGVAEAAHTAFGMAMLRTDNEQAAEKLAKASLLEDIKTRALGFQAKIESDKGKAALEELIMKLEMQREKEVRDGITHLLSSKVYMKGAGGRGGGGGGSGGGGGGMPAAAGPQGPQYLGRVDKDDVFNLDDKVGIVINPKHQERLTMYIDASNRLIRSTQEMADMAKAAKENTSLARSPQYIRKYQSLIADSRQAKATMDGSGVMNPHEVPGINQSLGAMGTMGFIVGTHTGVIDPEQTALEAKARLEANRRNTLLRNSRGVVVRPPGADGWAKIQTGKGASAQHTTVENWQATNLDTKEVLNHVYGGGPQAAQPAAGPAKTDERIKLLGK